MSFLSTLEGGLFAIGQVLRLPVMFALWICVLLTVYQIGLAGASVVREHGAKAFDIKKWIASGGVLEASPERLAVLPYRQRAFLMGIQKQLSEGTLHAGGLENVLAEHEERARKALDVARALVKVGPSLGLLGTLIPMGASLAAMSGGDLNAMAAHMTVAFTTTIVGIAVGTLAYGVVAFRQPALSRSIREQRYLAEAVASEVGLV